MKQMHYYASDDKTHDLEFVQHCLLLHWDWVVDVGVCIEEHWFLIHVKVLINLESFYLSLKYPDRCFSTKSA